MGWRKVLRLKAGKFEFSFGKNRMTVTHGAGYQNIESDIGQSSPLLQWTDRMPHPVNMGKYDEWCNDPEANIAFNVLSDIIAGVGLHTEMPEEEKDTKNKQIIDKYIDTVNLDEDLQEITMAMLQKGFAPVERLSNYDLKLLPPETFYVWRTRRGHIYRYTQEKPEHNVIAVWEDPKWKQQLESVKESYSKDDYKKLESWVPGNWGRGSYDAAPLDDIIMFFHRRTPNWPYGKSLVDPIGDLLTQRQKMNRDMPKAVHRWAYPIPFVYTRGSSEDLKKQCVDRDIDEWVFVGNVDKEDVWMDSLSVDPQARFIPYIELIWYQICEGLHAPLLLYLKNATEASATVMMESVDRLVNGIQTYLKKRVEKYLFEPQVGLPCPLMRWGAPKTGLEDITFTDLSSILAYLPSNQQQFIVKKYIPDLPEPIKDPEPVLASPLQDKNPPPPTMKQMQQMVERLNDLDTSLKIVETNFCEGRIGVADACKLADQTITVHMKRLHGESWVSYRDEMFSEFVSKRLLKVNKEKYTVQVD